MATDTNPNCVVSAAVDRFRFDTWIPSVVVEVVTPLNNVVIAAVDRSKLLTLVVKLAVERSKLFALVVKLVVVTAMLAICAVSVAVERFKLETWVPNVVVETVTNPN